MINNELLNKDTYVVTEKETLIILYRNSAICMAKNDKDIKHTINISIIMHSVINGEYYNVYKIVRSEVVLQLEDTVTNNVR